LNPLAVSRRTDVASAFQKAGDWVRALHFALINGICRRRHFEAKEQMPVARTITAR